MHNPLAIANYFIELAKNDDNLVSPIKLVYFAHGWCLALANKPLINEKVEAWQYGPEFKKYGNEGITSPAVEFKHLGDFKFANIIPTVEDNDVKKLLEKIWETYGGYTGWQLHILKGLLGVKFGEKMECLQIRIFPMKK